jgi:hypothetical protein
MFIITIGVDRAKFGNDAHFMSFAGIILLSEMGQRAQIFISETL